MSAREEDQRREPVGWTVAGFLAACAIFAALASLVYYPGRIGPGAMLVALLATAIGGTTGPEKRLCGVAVALSGLCWVAGMGIAIIFDRPIV